MLRIPFTPFLKEMVGAGVKETVGARVKEMFEAEGKEMVGAGAVFTSCSLVTVSNYSLPNLAISKSPD